MNKRGQGLSMNIVVVAILALLILLVVAILFMGGIGNVSSRIQSILNIGTQGMNVEIAQEKCNLDCSFAQGRGSDLAKMNSPYCKTTYNIDYDNSGTLDEGEIELFCYGRLNVLCPGVTC